MWIQKNGEHIKYPLNLDISKEKDKSKFGHFYDDYDHTTDECQNLKDEIEKLAKKGALNMFTR